MLYHFSRKSLAAVFVVLLSILALAQGPGKPTGVTVTAKPATPTISSLSVTSGLVGATVTLTGFGFNASQGSGIVTFNGTPATASSWAALSITVTVPTGATTGNVIVVQNGLSSGGILFTVTASGGGGTTFFTGLTRNAATCNFADVNAQVLAAADRDIINIPAGTCSWSSTLTVNKAIKMQGAGVGVTILQDNVSKGGASCSGGGPLMDWNVSAQASAMRITNFTIQGVSTDTGVCQRGHITVGGGTHNMRIDHLTINPANTVAIFISGDIWGLIDHYIFRTVFKNAVRVQHLNWNGTSNDPWGDQSWAQGLSIGSPQGVYVEDSDFADTAGTQSVAGALDCFDGGRVTWRYNVHSQANITTHGADSDQRHRGCRWTEMYNNTFSYSNVNQLAFIAWIRGGTGVFHDNQITASGYSNKLVQVVNCRDSDAGCGGGPSYAPWGACNGSATWDQNSGGGTGYRCVDQPGSGTSNLVSGDPASPAAWIGNILDPVYVWNNTRNGSADNQTAGSSHVQSGRDYITGTARPGYTTYTYPHPLQSGDIVGATPWEGIIASTRATDWSSAGATITNRTSVCATMNPGATAGQINTAITNCSTAGGGVVALSAGTFTLSSSIGMKNNVTLRGAGMSTIVSFTNMGGVTYYWGGGQAGIIFQGGYATPAEVAPGLASVTTATIRSWTGTNGQAGVYTQGATVLNLNTAPTGLAAGDTLVLYQQDDPDASVPNSGYFVSSKTGASGAISWAGSAETQLTGQQQRVRVVSVSGTAVTVAKGIRMPAGTWRTARTPQAGWFTVAQTIHDAGVESMLIRTTAMSAVHLAVIAMNWCTDCWVKGVALQPRNTSWHAGGAVDYGIYVTDSRNITVRDSWIDRMIGGGFFTTTSYGIALKTTFDSLVENNILNSVENPLMMLTASSGNVLGYNYERFVGDDAQEGGTQLHQVGSSMNLCEGSSFYKWQSDGLHGNTSLTTIFRAHAQSAGFDMWSYHRWYNYIGNVLNVTVYQSRAGTADPLFDRWSPVGFRLGYPQQNADTSPSNGLALDTLVATTGFRWGNYSLSDGTTHFTSSEVPTADAVFPNPIPANQTLPASFYRSARPGFFTVTGIGTVTWPPIGPDVTGGPMVAGHAYKLPAQLVYEAAGGVITSFNPALYGNTP